MQPQNTITASTAVSKKYPPGTHAYPHVMRVAQEDKLLEARHWVQGHGTRLKLTVLMPQHPTNVIVTRNRNDTFSVAPLTARLSEAEDPNLYRQLLDVIRGGYEKASQNGQLREGELTTQGLIGLLSEIKGMPCNRRVAPSPAPFPR